MSNETFNIPYNEIIKMYKQGYSCKEICLKFNISALTVRRFLRSAGFNTRDYRKVTEHNKNKVLLLIKSGYSYTQIEKLLNVSTHLIREIVSNANLIGFASKYHPPIKLNVSKNDVSLSLIEQLKLLYFTGEFGLAYCADKLKVSDKEFLWFVFHLDENDISMHSQNLEKNILEMSKNSLSASTIAKRMDISPSIVKKIVKKSC